MYGVPRANVHFIATITVCRLCSSCFTKSNHASFIKDAEATCNDQTLSSPSSLLTHDLKEVPMHHFYVLEVERTLKPGGVGAFLVGASGSNPNDLIRSATPVSSLLRSSNVVHVGYIDELNFVVFKKKDLKMPLPSISIGFQLIVRVFPLPNLSLT